jgi:hypothetical protein
MPHSPRLAMTGNRGSPIGSDFANPVLIARHRPKKSESSCGNVHRQTVHVVGEDDLGVDVCAGAHSANRIARRTDIVTNRSCADQAGLQ